MAKKALSLFRSHASAPAPVVVVAPSRGGKMRRRARAVGAVARRVGRRGGSLAKEHAVPAVGMAIGGAIAGALDAKGIFNKLPAIGGSRAATLAITGYAATRFVKNKYVRMAGLAAIAVGAFDAVKSHMVNAAPPRAAASPAPKGTSGHDDASGEAGDGGPY
jgi:hypothetical protein